MTIALAPTPMSKPIGAIVLAAGFSRRFGSRKLLAELQNGDSVFEQSLKRLAKAVPSIVVVTRLEMAPHLDEFMPQVKLALFDQADKGMGASLAFACSHIGDWSGCLVCMADMPFIRTATYTSLADQLTNDSIVLPTYQSKIGNPVAFGSQFFPELSNLDGDSGGKSIVKAHPESLKVLALDDPGILQDIDTREDLSRFQ